MQNHFSLKVYNIPIPFLAQEIFACGFYIEFEKTEKGGWQ